LIVALKDVFLLTVALAVTPHCATAGNVATALSADMLGNSSNTGCGCTAPSCIDGEVFEKMQTSSIEILGESRIIGLAC